MVHSSNCAQKVSCYLTNGFILRLYVFQIDAGIDDVAKLLSSTKLSVDETDKV